MQDKIYNTKTTYSFDEKTQNLQVTIAGNFGAFDGEHKSFKGQGKMLENCPSKFHVEFLWPFKSDYVFMDVGQDYNWLLVGTESRNHAWILAKSPQLDDIVMKNIFNKLEKNGFDIHKFQYTSHFFK